MIKSSHKIISTTRLDDQGGKELHILIAITVVIDPNLHPITDESRPVQDNRPSWKKKSFKSY
jgi:hypothetical protein